MGQDMAGGDVQKIAFRPVCTHHLGMGKSILRFSSVFNATHGVGVSSPAGSSCNSCCSGSGSNSSCSGRRIDSITVASVIVVAKVVASQTLHPAELSSKGYS